MSADQTHPVDVFIAIAEAAGFEVQLWQENLMRRYCAEPVLLLTPRGYGATRAMVEDVTGTITAMWTREDLGDWSPNRLQVPLRNWLALRRLVAANRRAFASSILGAEVELL